MKTLILSVIIVMITVVPALAQYTTTEISGEYFRGSANVGDYINGENGSMLIFDLNTIMVRDFSIGLKAGQGEIQNVDSAGFNLLKIYGKYDIAPEVGVLAGYKNLRLGDITFKGLTFGGDFTVDFDSQLDIKLKVNYLPFLQGSKGVGTYNATAYEVDAGISYELFDRLYLIAGYRTMRYILEYDTDDIDANFSGIYAGFSHSF